MTESEWEIPNDPDVDPEDIEPGVDLSGADLSDADLSQANLSGADISDADLSSGMFNGADFSEADMFDCDLSSASLIGVDFSRVDLIAANLSETDLFNANLSKADLFNANLSGARLRFATLTEAKLKHANLTEAYLRDADFSNSDLTRSILKDAILWNTSLSDALISRQTVFTPPRKQLEDISEDETNQYLSNPVDYADTVARANNELRNVYSENGLISQAREARARERRARRKEAKVDDTLQGTIAWLGSLISRWTTGYGVKLLPVVGVMMTLFLGSAAVYSETGMAASESLYYSVVTFTTSPPSPPDPGLMRLVAGIETFLGTTMIVFLGYVLGAREQV